MDFKIIGTIRGIETIAVGPRIRDIRHLRRKYGRGRWRKLKEFALVHDYTNDETYSAEIHWYEATGVGSREFKIKARLD